jgi:protein-disulfide isomerase-like protein with CxxC motif
MNQALPISSFPTLALTRSGAMSMISGSLQNHLKKEINIWDEKACQLNYHYEEGYNT